jgi:hypothetical protein
LPEQALVDWAALFVKTVRHLDDVVGAGDAEERDFRSERVRSGSVGWSV